MGWRSLAIACLLEQASAVGIAWSGRGKWGPAKPSSVAWSGEEGMDPPAPPGDPAESTPIALLPPMEVLADTPAGATSVYAGIGSIWVLTRVEHASAGDYLRLSSGSQEEVVTIAQLNSAQGTILLTEATQCAFPAYSVISVVHAPTAAVCTTTTAITTTTTTTAATVIVQSGGTTTTTTVTTRGQNVVEQVASVVGDPHVTNLNGERFDIRMPSPECTLLRVPYSEEEPEMLELRASMDTDALQTCGLYVRAVALRGSLLDNQVVRVRPHTRNAEGSNQAGNETKTNFSLQVGNSSWMDFSREEIGTNIPEASVGFLRARFVWREAFGRRVEAQGLELRLGEGERPVVLTISQAPHQALNLEVKRLGILGHRRVGGALGTEGHNVSLEQPSLSCRRVAAPSSGQRRAVKGGDFPGVDPRPAAAPASSMSAWWD